jgi:hypothetical protein
MLNDKTAVSTFLYYGYLPSPDAALPPWLGVLADGQGPPRATEHRDLASWVAAGVSLLKRVFRDTLGDASGDHVVPLSGGLDSRAILSGLLENVQTHAIRTVTFGSPGMWDYEIGQQVARAAGVRCTMIDLSSKQWSWDTAALVQTARRIGRPIGVFDAHVNLQVPTCGGAGNVYWSGFMGNPLDGDHLFPQDSTDWDQARRRFVRHNRVCGIDLAPPGFDPQRCLPPAPLLDGASLRYDEQLDFVVRQQGLIQHIVMPHGYAYRAPFLHPEWVRFILSVPRRYRQGRYLYKEILKTAYGQLFSLPVKCHLGLPLQTPRWRRQARLLNLGVRGLARRLAPRWLYSIPPGRNYMDFDHALRRRPDLRTVVEENLQDLKRRGLVDWIDIEDLWRRHQQGQGNHADALMVLASLEIHLKAQGEMGP